jgi:hypothetical protein
MADKKRRQGVGAANYHAAVTLSISSPPVSRLAKSLYQLAGSLCNCGPLVTCGSTAFGLKGCRSSLSDRSTATMNVNDLRRCSMHLLGIEQ